MPFRAPQFVSGLWDNSHMTKGRIVKPSWLLVCLSIFLLAWPNSAYAKPDPQVLKECLAVKLDQKSFMTYLNRPLSPERDAARLEIDKLNARPELLNCNKLDLKTWKSIKSDYIKTINQANLNMQKIVAKYFKEIETEITCIKNGQIKKVIAVKPTCPSGYKKLY
jgi:hypothetical protein